MKLILFLHFLILYYTNGALMGANERQPKSSLSSRGREPRLLSTAERKETVTCDPGKLKDINQCCLLPQLFPLVQTCADRYSKSTKEEKEACLPECLFIYEKFLAKRGGKLDYEKMKHELTEEGPASNIWYDLIKEAIALCQNNLPENATVASGQCDSRAATIISILGSYLLKHCPSPAVPPMNDKDKEICAGKIKHLAECSNNKIIDTVTVKKEKKMNNNQKKSSNGLGNRRKKVRDGKKSIAVKNVMIENNSTTNVVNPQKQNKKQQGDGSTTNY